MSNPNFDPTAQSDPPAENFPSPQSAKGVYAARARIHGLDSPAATEAKKTLVASKIAAYIERVVSEAPPLSADQRARLAALLTGGGAS